MSAASERETREHFARLMALPVNDPNRACLRDAVPYGPAKLATLARKFTTPQAIGKALPARWWNVTNSKPLYPAWCKATTQGKPVPFESGHSVLPGLEAFAIEHGILQGKSDQWQAAA